MATNVAGASRPVMLYACSGVDTAAWLTALRRELPDIELREYPNAGNPAEIDFAFVWKYPPGLLGTLPNLRAIFALGAGIESILADPSLPARVPLVRMVDPGLAVGMNEFVLMRVLHYHRQMPLHEANQRAQPLGRGGAAAAAGSTGRSARLRRVGRTLCADTCRARFRCGGLGAAGTAARRHCRLFHGADQLPAFLARTEILVCLLPLTADTAGIVNAQTFALLPRGAFFINVARGQHVVDADLLAALDSGHDRR